MKVALCFMISYDHILNKEEIWRAWIRENEDIINVYFFYKDQNKITSSWILEHCIPNSCIYKTSYFHVIPAYLSLMHYAFQEDRENQWFCFLTESCCPIISPQRFRYLFFQNYNKTIMSWKKAWWNLTFHKRANLALLPKELHLGNDPWFIMKREHIQLCLNYIQKKQPVVKLICDGGLANESLFAIILHSYGELQSMNVLNSTTHVADWSRMMNATSPYLFSYVSERDIEFIETTIQTSPYTIFIRKVSPNFSDETLKHYIYEYQKEKYESFTLYKFHYFNSFIILFFIGLIILNFL